MLDSVYNIDFIYTWYILVHISEEGNIDQLLWASYSYQLPTVTHIDAARLANRMLQKLPA